MGRTLKDGLTEDIFDFGKYYGRLTFLELRSTQLDADENGEMTKVRKRVYNVLSDGQRTIIHVSVPAEVEEVDIPRDTPVKLVNPVVNFMAVVNYPSVSAVEYITADNIVPLAQGQSTQPIPPQGQKQNVPAHDDKK